MFSKSLCRVQVEQGELFLLTTLWEDGSAGMDLAITDCHKAWTGAVSEEVLGERAKAMKMEFEDYVTETKKAMTRRNVGNLNFEYSFKKDRSEFCFSWKKFMAKDKIRIQLGQASMTEEGDMSAVLRGVLEHSIQSAVLAQQEIQALHTDNQRLAAERAGTMKRLDKAVAAKIDMENDLYLKFVQVINSKKKKVREYKEEIDKSESYSQPDTSGKSLVQKRARQKAIDSEEEHSDPDSQGSDYHTDDEQSCLSPTKKIRSVEKGLDDSMHLSLNIEQEAVPTARQRRGRRQVTKKTPSKAVLPKVLSSENKKGTQGRPSLAKGDSFSSNQSNVSRRSSDPDCEDLLADL